MIGGVSRSGRIRKKSSKLADFESPDEIEKPIVKKKPIKETQASASPSVNTVESTPKVEYSLNDFENAPDQQVDDDIDASEDDGGALVIDDSRKTGLKRKRTPSEVDKSKTGSPFLIWGKSRRRELAAQNPGWTPGELAQQLWAQWQKLPEAEKQAVKAKIDPVEDTQPPAKKKRSPPVGSLGSPNSSTVAPVPSTGKITPKIPPGTDILDSAAHLKLLGESLAVIGERLTKHVGQIALSGSLSVLMDSLVCAMGPLMCLTQHVTELNGAPPEQLKQILDNVAYIMPGL